MDRLTGLPNAWMFTRRIKELVGSVPRRRFGVCHIDIDRFEGVNQALGREVGDQLLIQVAQRLTALAGRSGQLVARLGSDRFGILIDQTINDSGAAAMAQAALTALAEPYWIGAHRLDITASAGVVETSALDTTAAEVLSAANVALQWAKADGKAQCRVFEPERHAREVRRHLLWLAMPAALACGQFTLHYQPLVDLHDGHVAGVEALARWNHPHHGLLGPDSFIAIAEETGLIVSLGAMLLRQACEDAAGWVHNGHKAPYVSVNLAAAQLRDDTLYTTVVNTLAHTGLDPRRLQLEITEHSVIDTDGRIPETLHALSRLGIRIAIDDFGTGYSNLATLPALPLNELKLAHPFVHGGSRAFLTSVVRIGHSLNLTMTAEGIETRDQADLMRDLGCHTGQGWYFSRPLTAAGLRTYLLGRPPTTTPSRGTRMRRVSRRR